MPRGPAQMTSCESSVVNFPIDRVWDAVRPLRFDWSSALSSDGAEPTGAPPCPAPNSAAFAAEACTVRPPGVMTSANQRKQR